MHKCVAVFPDELVVASLADDGESKVTASTYFGRKVLAVPGIGGRLREIVKYRWIVIIAAIGLVVVGCIPAKSNRFGAIETNSFKIE